MMGEVADTKQIAKRADTGAPKLSSLMTCERWIEVIHIQGFGTDLSRRLWCGSLLGQSAAISGCSPRILRCLSIAKHDAAGIVSRCIEIESLFQMFAVGSTPSD